MQIALAEALLRRKELQLKVDQLTRIKQSMLETTVVDRVNVSDSTDAVTARVPKCSMDQLTHCFDFHSKALRLIDGAIQQANWNTMIEVKPVSMDDYVDPYVVAELKSKV